MLVIAMLVAFTACEKEEVEEVPGEIPGMGNAGGELEVEAFAFPDDIEFVGAITGIGGSSRAVQGQPYLKSASVDATYSHSCYGSGGQHVKLKLTVKNNNPTLKRTVYFPPGLIFKVNIGGYQNAILLDCTWICVQPGETREFLLYLYCINLGKNGSDSTSEYEILGTTKSSLMLALISWIHWREINWEHHYLNVETNKAELKKGLTNVSYEEIANKLQDAVWAITNGTGLTDEQIEFMQSIPMLPEGTYPKELDDKTLEPPYYFEEYTPVD